MEHDNFIPTPSEAVVALTGMVSERINEMVQDLAGIALRDAGLDPKDGWRYNLSTRTYEKA